MGKIKQGVLGGFSGKVGPVVGSSWKGIAVMKSKPLSVANPRTSGQVNQRNSMSAIVIVAQLLLSYAIKPLWDRFAQQMSGYNMFVQTNIACWVSGIFTNYSAFKLSVGKMESTPISMVVATNGATGITPNWVDSPGTGFKLSTDLAYVAVYGVRQDKWYYSTDNATRQSEAALVPIEGNVETGDVYHCYLSFRRTDGTIIDTSSYLSKTV